MGRQRRTVLLSDLNTKPVKGGRYPTVYGYTNLDLSALFGVSLTTIRRWKSLKLLDSSDIKSVCELYVKRANLGQAS